MAKIEIASAFVEEQVGNPVFVLKVAEPHSRKDDQGQWQTVSRTFFDVKVSRESQIDLSQFAKGSRIQVWGSQKTEVREHQGKKFYTLVIWADRIEAAQGSQRPQGGPNGGGQASWGQPAQNGPQTGGQGFGGGFADEQPF